MTNPLAQDLGGVVLLPCPFCGGDPIMWAATDCKDGFVHGTTINCQSCGISINDEYQDAAIAAWNTRAHAAEIAVALAAFQRVRDALEQPDLIGPASHFRSEEEVIQTRVLRTLIRHELNWHTAMQQGG